MGLNYFMIDGVSSLDFGVVISNAAVFNAPSRAFESVNVPGRNGAILFDEGYYENVTVSYEASLLNKGVNLDGFRAWLMSFTSYHRIEDTYHSEEYRIGIPDGGFEATMNEQLAAGTFKVQFNCKPQRFLKSGELFTRYTSGATLFNPTHFTSKPMIRVYGAGDIGIGEDTVTIKKNDLEYIDLDCDLCDATCGSTNANIYVTLSGDDYPALKAGKTGITLGNGITAVEIAPRWWTL